MRLQLLPFCHACWQIDGIPKPYKQSCAVRCSNLTVHPSHLLQKAWLQNLNKGLLFEWVTKGAQRIHDGLQSWLACSYFGGTFAQGHLSLTRQSFWFVVPWWEGTSADSPFSSMVLQTRGISSFVGPSFLNTSGGQAVPVSFQSFLSSSRTNLFVIPSFKKLLSRPLLWLYWRVGDLLYICWGENTNLLVSSLESLDLYLVHLLLLLLSYPIVFYI